MTAPRIATAPPGTANGAAHPPGAPPPAPPPNPKQQAVTFALELAKIRATGAVGSDKVTTAQQLITDAETIAAFIRQPPRP